MSGALNFETLNRNSGLDWDVRAPRPRNTDCFPARPTVTDVSRNEGAKVGVYSAEFSGTVSGDAGGRPVRLGVRQGSLASSIRTA